MAIVLSLKRDATTLDLTDAFVLREGGWLSAVATPVYGGDPPPVVETMHFNLTDTNHNNIAAEMQGLHDMQIWANAYISDPTEDDPVYLHCKMANETGERRALVYNIDVQYGASYFGTESVSLTIPVTIVLTRSPYWERTTARDLPSWQPSAAIIYSYDYTSGHDIVGDVGARISRLVIHPDTSDQFQVVWMGIRSANKHVETAIANFVTTWELEDGTNDATDASDAGDSTASGGNRVTVSESSEQWDNEWNLVLHITMADVTSNPEDNLGSFLNLLRAKLSAAGSWEIQLKYSYETATTERIEGPIFEVNQTTWNFYEAGVITYPLRSLKASTAMAYTDEDYLAIYLYARRTSGTSDLYLDVICPIPVDEGFAKVISSDAVTDAGNRNLDIAQGINGDWGALVFNDGGVGSTLPSYLCEISVNNFTLPPGDGRLIVAHNKSKTESDYTQGLDFNISNVGKYFERWLSLRGLE